MRITLAHIAVPTSTDPAPVWRELERIESSWSRKAFGVVINNFQGVSFQISEAVTLLDAARSMGYTTCRAIDAGVNTDRTRRMIFYSFSVDILSRNRIFRVVSKASGGSSSREKKTA